MSDVVITATFASEDDCAKAIGALHEAHVRDFRAYAPVPSEKINEAASEARGLGPSPVRVWVLIGGIVGALSGLVLTVGTSWEWNLNTGGKPVASIPPFIIIIFELMILTGGLMGLLGFFLHSRLPAFESEPGFRSRFAGDKFGAVIRCSEGDASRIETLLRNCGAEEVSREAAQQAA